MSLNKKLEQAERALDRSARGIERRLLRNYQQALKEVRGLIATIAYEKYGGDYNQLQKYNRLANLEKGIGKEIGKLTGKNAVTLKSGIASQFEEAHYRTAFSLEKEVTAKLGFGQLNPKVIEAAVDNPLDRVGFLQRNRQNQRRLTQQLQERLTQGLIQGKSYQDVARDIKERMDVGATNTQRIAQTEMHRAQQEGRMEALEQAHEKGVNMVKVWTATLDDRTRDTHQSLDGQKVGMEEEFEIRGSRAKQPGGFGIPEEDINCRCAVRPEIVGYEPEVRRAREVEGRRGEIQSYRTYNEWKQGRIND